MCVSFELAKIFHKLFVFVAENNQKRTTNTLPVLLYSMSIQWLHAVHRGRRYTCTTILVVVLRVATDACHTSTHTQQLCLVETVYVHYKRRASIKTYTTLWFISVLLWYEFCRFVIFQ